MQVVDLFEARDRELFEQGRSVDAVADEPYPAHPAGNATQRAKIDVDDSFDVGPLNLDDDVVQAGFRRVEVGEYGAVGLPERRGGDRFWVN